MGRSWGRKATTLAPMPRRPPPSLRRFGSAPRRPPPSPQPAGPTQLPPPRLLRRRWRLLPQLSQLPQLPQLPQQRHPRSHQRQYRWRR